MQKNGEMNNKKLGTFSETRRQKTHRLSCIQTTSKAKQHKEEVPMRELRGWAEGFRELWELQHLQPIAASQTRASHLSGNQGSITGTENLQSPGEGQTSSERVWEPRGGGEQNRPPRNSV